jgi:hypothetical protein
VSIGSQQDSSDRFEGVWVNHKAIAEYSKHFSDLFKDMGIPVLIASKELFRFACQKIAW